MRQSAAERDLLLRRGGWVKNQLLYRVSLAEQEYLAFCLWSHKWKASVTAETKPGSPDSLTAAMTKKEAVYRPWLRWTNCITRTRQQFARLDEVTAVVKTCSQTRFHWCFLT